MQHLLLTAVLATFGFMAACDPKPVEPIEPVLTECQIKCALKPEQGPCNGAFTAYYFDPVAKKCKEFFWGGCMGVVPFETLAACDSCGCK